MADITEDEMKQMAEIFKEMGVKPKCGSTEDFQRWMLDYLQAMGKLPEVSERKHTPAESSDKPSRELIVTQQQLRLPTFSGDSAKADVTYDLWRNEVDCLLADGTYSETQILQSARKSLRGEAAGVSLRMRTEGSIHDLLEKLEAVYGAVELGETLLSQFYSAQQKEQESVATWGCRVEDLLDKARRRGQVASEAMEEMLRTKFWTGLRPELKASSRHKFDTVKHFDTLKKELRAIEYEQRMCQDQVRDGQLTTQTSKPKLQVKSAQPKTTSGGEGAEKAELQELKGLVLSLQNQVKEFQSWRPVNGFPTQGPVQNDGIFQSEMLPSNPNWAATTGYAVSQQPGPPQSNHFQPQHFQAQARGPTQPPQWPRPPPRQDQGLMPSRFGPCYNCGGRHMKRDCPTLQQHNHLNFIAQTLGGDCLQRTSSAPIGPPPQEVPRMVTNPPAW